MPRPRKDATKRSERETVVTLRLPIELHERLKKAGGERGLTAQIRDRLDASLAVEEAWGDPVFANLLRACSYTGIAAATLYPADPDAYLIVELAIRMLLSVFRPEGSPDPVHEVFVAATVPNIRKVERLIGFALGHLGDAGLALAAKLPVFHIEEEDKQ